MFGSRRRRKSTNPPGHSHYASEELSNLQNGPFERFYAIKWLTALIGEEAKSSNTARTKQEAEETTITLELTDVSLDNQDHGSVDSQTWGGACIMDEMIVENPLAFCLGAKGFFFGTDSTLTSG